MTSNNYTHTRWSSHTLFVINSAIKIATAHRSPQNTQERQALYNEVYNTAIKKLHRGHRPLKSNVMEYIHHSLDTIIEHNNHKHSRER